MRYKHYEEVTYTTGLGNKGLTALAGTGSYQPEVAMIDNSPYIQEVGLHRVGDCIGLIARHPESGTVYFHHINSVFNHMIGAGLLRLAIKSNLVPKEKSKYFETLLDNINSGNADIALLEIKNLGLMKDIQFNIITSNLGDGKKMEELLTVLQNAGVLDDNIYIDTKQSQMIICRKTGKLCAEFDFTKSVYHSPQEALDIALAEKANNMKAKEIEYLSAAKRDEIVEALKQRGFLKIENNVMRFYLKPSDAFFLSDPLKKIWEDTLNSSAGLGVTEIEFSLSRSIAGESIEHSKLISNIITTLGECNHIKSLKIIFPHQCDQKTVFMSIASIELAQILISQGVHLHKIELKANSEGAKECAKTIKQLAEKGELREFTLTPIVDKWRNAAEVNNLLEEAREIISRKNNRSGVSNIAMTTTYNERISKSETSDIKPSAQPKLQ